MIRINLLPQGKKGTQSTSSGSGQLWAVIYLLAAFIWIVGLGLIYFQYKGELEGIQAENRRLDQRIAELQRRTQGIEELRARLQRSRQLEEVVAELERSRTGPLRVVMELSRVLSNPGGPTIDAAHLAELRADNPYAGFREGWDVKRVWLRSFVESERRCTIQGAAKTNEDVAEFLRRLDLSELFTSIRLERTNEDSEGDITFVLQGEVQY